MKTLVSQSESDFEPKVAKTPNLDIKPKSHVHSVIDLNKDSKRKQIGFETESVNDKEWKEISIDWNNLLSNYAKLSKKNLTGNCYQVKKN